MRIKKEDIKRIINILEAQYNELKDGEYFEFNGKGLSKNSFKIPDKWCIRPNNQEELELIFEFVCKKREAKTLHFYYHYPHLPLNVPGSSEDCWASSSPELEIITFEQFREFIKNKE
jgi:hypothetical protein